MYCSTVFLPQKSDIWHSSFAVFVTPHHHSVRCCTDCFLKNVAWDSTRTYDLLGPADGKPIVLVHGALAGRQCLVLEARAFAAAGYRWEHSTETHAHCAHQLRVWIITGICHPCALSLPPAASYSSSNQQWRLHNNSVHRDVWCIPLLCCTG